GRAAQRGGQRDVEPHLRRRGTDELRLRRYAGDTQAVHPGVRVRVETSDVVLAARREQADLVRPLRRGAVVVRDAHADRDGLATPEQELRVDVRRGGAGAGVALERAVAVQVPLVARD